MGDDSVRRFVVRHYRYDPHRHQRRHVVVAAFDNEAEYLALLGTIRADIDRRIAAGEPVDHDEHASGTVYEPGHLLRAANGHVFTRMTEHGVDPRPWLQEHELPSNIGFLTAEVGSSSRWWSRAAGLIRGWLRGGGRP